LALVVLHSCRLAGLLPGLHSAGEVYLRRSNSFLAGRLGFEPRQSAPKALDLPLVDRPVQHTQTTTNHAGESGCPILSEAKGGKQLLF
jgi:hypothetical protein